MHSTPHYVDSLRSGALDIAVIPFRDSLAIDSLFISVPVDSVSYWLINSDSRAKLDEINFWLVEYHASPLCDELHRKFLEVPKTGKVKDFISPYDSLMREVCEPLGEDWRLIAAIAYQESHFRIEVRSRRGAAGMMQMMPVTARRYGVENIADPRQSLEAGVKYFQHLKKDFRKDAADADELRRFALAAYNAGEGRLRASIDNADSLGRETIAFVESVERRYQHYRKLFK